MQRCVPFGFRVAIAVVHLDLVNGNWLAVVDREPPVLISVATAVAAPTILAVTSTAVDAVVCIVLSVCRAHPRTAGSQQPSIRIKGLDFGQIEVVRCPDADALGKSTDSS